MGVEKSPLFWILRNFTDSPYTNPPAPCKEAQKVPVGECELGPSELATLLIGRSQREILLKIVVPKIWIKPDRHNVKCEQNSLRIVVKELVFNY